MELFKRLMHWLRITFTDACPDPNCTGRMLMYDDRVHRDHCSICGKTEMMFDEEKRKKADTK